MPLRTRSADLLQRALEGERVSHPEVAALAATAARIPSLTGPACAPRPEFVQDLGARLRALDLPARSRPARRPAAGAPERPRVIVVGRGLPRLLAGVTAALLVVGAVVGIASRGALPGGLLYPVKELLDDAAVRLAGSGLDRGTTLLAQGQEHISDAAALVDGGDTAPSHVDEALGGAYESVGAGQRVLLGVYERDHDERALLAMQDFATRAVPQLQALRPRVHGTSVAQVDRLLALLQSSRAALTREVRACGPTCAGLLGATAAPGRTAGSTPGRTGTPAPLATTGPPGSGAARSGAGVTLPGATAPGGVAGGGGAGVGSSSGTVGLGGGGASASLPGATVPLGGSTATLPSASASLGLPSASLGTGGAGIGAPAPVLGSRTLPGASATLTAPTSLPQLP